MRIRYTALRPTHARLQRQALGHVATIPKRRKSRTNMAHIARTSPQYATRLRMPRRWAKWRSHAHFDICQLRKSIQYGAHGLRLQNSSRRHITHLSMLYCHHWRSLHFVRPKLRRAERRIAHRLRLQKVTRPQPQFKESSCLSSYLTPSNTRAICADARAWHSSSARSQTPKKPTSPKLKRRLPTTVPCRRRSILS